MKILSKLFENIFKVADHQQRDTGVVHHFYKIAIFIATPMKKHI